MRLRIKQEGPARFVIEKRRTPFTTEWQEENCLGRRYWIPLTVHGEEAKDLDDTQTFETLKDAKAHAKAIIKKVAERYPVYHDIEE